MDYKSPFLIVRELLSPLQCEDIISRLKHTIPNMDQNGLPTVSFKGNRLSELRIQPSFENILPNIESYFNFKTKTLTPMVFEWYPTGFNGNKPECDGYRMISKRGKSTTWNKTKDYDFTVITFLNDYNETHNFDERFEVRGGKLEFPSHDFGFNPVRGTSIIFPCCPNFINAIGPVELGNLNTVKFHIIATEEYIYDMEKFPGNYKVWFNNS